MSVLAVNEPMSSGGGSGDEVEEMDAIVILPGARAGSMRNFRISAGALKITEYSRCLPSSLYRQSHALLFRKTCFAVVEPEQLPFSWRRGCKRQLKFDPSAFDRRFQVNFKIWIIANRFDLDAAVFNG